MNCNMETFSSPSCFWLCCFIKAIEMLTKTDAIYHGTKKNRKQEKYQKDEIEKQLHINIQRLLCVLSIWYCIVNIKMTLEESSEI